MCDEIVPVIANDKEAMTAAELTEKPGLLNLKHRIQFNKVDPEHSDECKPHSQPRPMRTSRIGMEGAQGTSGNTRTPLLMSRRKTLKHHAEVEAEFHVEEEKAAEIKKQVQTAKNSPETQQLRAATALKEVAEMHQKCSYSVKVQEHKSGQEHSVKTDSRTHGADMRK